MPFTIDGKFAYEKNFGFGLKGLKNFPELIPLCGFLGFAIGMAGTFMGYALWQKPDVRVLKNTELPPCERVEAETRQKLFTVKQEYRRIPELEALRREIGSYKS